ncbi:MAG: hypothetical protein WC261_04665 [Synergistaceae bacterium]|jgi:hypothetical protein
MTTIDKQIEQMLDRQAEKDQANLKSDRVKRGMSGSERGKPGQSVVPEGNAEPGTENGSAAASAEPDALTTLLPGVEVSDREERVTTVTALRDGQEIATWVEFWEFLMGKAGKDFPAAISKLKEGLLTVIGTVESFIKTLKAIVKAGAAIAGFLLNTASAYLALGKALLKVLRGILDSVLSIMEAPLLKSEIKLAHFNLFSGGIDPAKIDMMGPVVSAKLQEMTTTWMNRPVAEDQLCTLMFLPMAVPAEVAKVAGTTVRFADMLSKMLKDRKKKAPDGTLIVPEDVNELSHILRYLSETYSNHSADRDALVIRDEILLLVDKALTAFESLTDVQDSLAVEIMENYGAVVELENSLARQAGSDSAVEGSPESIPGIGVFRSRLNKKEDAVILESNYLNNRHRYLSSVFHISVSGEVTEIFADPTFRYLKAISTGNVLDAVESSAGLFSAMRTWYTTFKGRTAGSRLLYLGEMKLADVILATAEKLMGTENGKYYLTRLLDPSDKSVQLAILSHLAETAGGKFNFDPEKAYKSQLKKISGVSYSKRTIASASQPLYPSEITIKGGMKKGDRLFIMLDSHECMYLTPGFANRGFTSLGNSWNAAVNTYTPGKISASADTLTLSLQIRDKEDQGIVPRWYGIQTPPGVDNWTASRLFDMMGDGFRESIEYVYAVIDGAADSLSEMEGQVDEWKKKLRAMLAVINKCFKMVEDIIKAIKDMIEALSLTDLPTVYIAVWRGSSSDIPAIAARGLIEKKWLNSTYGGVLLFGAENMADTVLEAWESYDTAVTDTETLQSMMIAESAATIRNTEALTAQLEAAGSTIKEAWQPVKPGNNRRSPFVDIRTPVIFPTEAMFVEAQGSDIKDVFKILSEFNKMKYRRSCSVEEGISENIIIPPDKEV